MASVSDGLLDVIIFKKTDIFQILPLLIAVLNGDHVNHQAVEYLQAREITIENLSGKEIALDYDGEYFEDGFPAKVSLIPHGIQIMVPKKEELPAAQ